MNADAETMIVPADYPELQRLVWSFDALRPIPSSEAFALYERNWRFVDAAYLTDREARLIENLKVAFGNGVMFSS